MERLEGDDIDMVEVGHNGKLDVARVMKFGSSKISFS